MLVMVYVWKLWWHRVFLQRCISHDRFCLSDPSVTRWYHAKTTPVTIMRSSLFWMTLNDLERPERYLSGVSGAEKMRVLEPTAQIWMKIDLYMQRQKCRPMTTFWKYKVYADTRGGSSWRSWWGFQMRVGLMTTAIFGDLSGYFFRNFRDKASNIIWRYAIPCWPVTDCKMNDLEWPW